jgi:2-polyprenyl-3-methyl-5-hydroxy-6-metoxy-1,4-benzoquinol methylase
MTQEVLQHCPVCEQTAFKPFLECTDYLVTKQKFIIQVCTNCDFRFTNPRPNAESLGDYYQSADYISHNDKGGGLINRIYRIVRNYTLKTKLDLINKLHPMKGKLLDVGCGTGLFLDTCKKGGWTISGIEPDAKAREVATDRLAVDITAEISQANPDPVDIITLWHVLEHVPDLHETLTELNKRLTVGGTLLLALPNSNSSDAVHYQEHWAAYDIPRHLSHFTPKTITQLVSQFGFHLQETKPMYFDAFYIAMLSTKYQSGSTKLFESFIEGVKSNFKARQSGNYSSLIYIFKKSTQG